MPTQKPYHKVSSYEAHAGDVKKVVLLYSGGLDTSVMLKWLQDEYHCDVIALTIDIGQMADDLAAIQKKAVTLGAIDALVIDAKQEFGQNYIAPALKANACYQGDYHLATCIGRPLLAKIAVQVAEQYGADAIAHGCTGKGNDQVRIETGILTLNPSMKIIAPVREWSLGRDEEIAYAKKHHIPIPHTLEKPYSYDDNMWGISAEGGEIEDPTLVPPLEKILAYCTLPENAPQEPEMIQVGFKEGLPVSLNGKAHSLVEMVAALNVIGAKHGVGINVHIEDRLVGLKIRDVYESPAAHILITAHKVLEKSVCTREENQEKEHIDQKWAYLCYGAKWYDPVMTHLNAFVDSLNRKVIGEVTLKLYKGSVSVLAVTSPYLLVKKQLATFMTASEGLALPDRARGLGQPRSDSGVGSLPYGRQTDGSAPQAKRNGPQLEIADFNQNASPGFIEIFSLEAKIAHQVSKKSSLNTSLNGHAHVATLEHPTPVA